jgi:hypothetical protein
MHMIRHPAHHWVLLLVLLLCAFPISAASAQEVIPIQYGTAVVNTITAAGQMVNYTFNGTIGDLVTIRAVGISPGSDPNLALVGPPQQVLATNDNVFSVPPTTAAQIIFRLQATGPHFIVVSGPPGDFLLTLESRPAAPLVFLQPDTPTTITFPIVEPAQAFVFNTDPVFATTLLMDATPFTLDAYVEVRDGTGQLIATLRSNLDNACISIGPGDQLLELTVIALSPVPVTGTMTIAVSNAPCVFGPVPAENPPVPTPEFTPVVVEGVCAASSPRNVNIRSGPGTNYARLALLQAGIPIQVVGQSQDGQWFVVQNDVVQGWLAARVVSVTGPCAQLPVVAAPPLPAATATPFFPVIVIPPPVVITTTPMPTVPVPTAAPVIVTATPPPQVPTNTLPPAQPTATPTLTLTMTPTLTATP